MVWDCPDFCYHCHWLCIIFRSSVHYLLPAPSWLASINFPLTEGKKKDKEHKDRAEYQAFKGGLPWPADEQQPMTPDAWANSTQLRGRRRHRVARSTCGRAAGLSRHRTWDQAQLAKLISGYFGHTWQNEIALCGNPAACILAAATMRDCGASGHPKV